MSQDGSILPYNEGDQEVPETSPERKRGVGLQVAMPSEKRQGPDLHGGKPALAMQTEGDPRAEAQGCTEVGGSVRI